MDPISEENVHMENVIVAPSMAVPLRRSPSVDIINKVRENLSAGSITVSNYNVAIIFAVELVEKMEKINGHQKKEIVIYVIETLLEEIPEDNPDKELIVASITLLLPGIIDIIIASSNGQFAIKKKEQIKKGCCFIC